MGCVRMMKLKSFTDMNGSLLQILNIVGEIWILLIICDANLGVTRSCFA
jgi:DNA-binding HxlR family transcriptional regulator